MPPRRRPAKYPLRGRPTLTDLIDQLELSGHRVDLSCAVTLAHIQRFYGDAQATRARRYILSFVEGFMGSRGDPVPVGRGAIPIDVLRHAVASMDPMRGLLH